MADKTTMNVEELEHICENENKECDNNFRRSFVLAEFKSSSFENINFNLRRSLSLNSGIDSYFESLSISSEACSTDSGISEQSEAMERMETEKIKVKNEVFEIIPVQKMVAQWEEMGTNITTYRSSLNQDDNSPQIRHDPGEKKERFKKVLEEIEEEDAKEQQKRIKRQFILDMKDLLQQAKIILNKMEIQFEEQRKNKENDEKVIEENNLNNERAIKQIKLNKKKVTFDFDLTIFEISIAEEKRTCDEIQTKKSKETSIPYRVKSNNFIRRLVKSFDGVTRKDIEIIAEEKRTCDEIQRKKSKETSIPYRLKSNNFIRRLVKSFNGVTRKNMKL